MSGFTLEHPGAVVILPFLLRDGRLVLIENRRIVVGRTVLEVPAGTLSPGEDSWAAARRELEEETGYVGGSGSNWERILRHRPFAMRSCMYLR